MAVASAQQVSREARDNIGATEKAPSIQDSRSGSKSLRSVRRLSGAIADRTALSIGANARSERPRHSSAICRGVRWRSDGSDDGRQGASSVCVAQCGE
jgi:hypothetical protein